MHILVPDFAILSIIIVKVSVNMVSPTARLEITICILCKLIPAIYIEPAQLRSNYRKGGNCKEGPKIVN